MKKSSVLSNINQWSYYKNMKPNYWADFLLVPPAIIALLYSGPITVSWVLQSLLGFALWGLAEYWVHRTVLHRLFWHSIHQRHHTHPEEYVTYPWSHVLAYILAFVVAFLILPTPVFTGILLGYLWFMTWHHMLHHWDLTNYRLIRAYANWHNVHHRGVKANYGISHPLFDLIFGTYRRARR